MTILTELRKLAEAATGTEPWIQEFVDVRCVEGGLICATRAVSDARYIAALSPSVVLAMLDVIEAAKAMRNSGDFLLIGDVVAAADNFDAALAKLESDDRVIGPFDNSDALLKSLKEQEQSR